MTMKLLLCFLRGRKKRYPQPRISTADIATPSLTTSCSTGQTRRNTYLGAWNSIPPQRPNHLAAYLGKITRNLALNRYKRNSVAKRGSGQVEIALSELENCIPDNTDVERAVEDSLIASVINRFLYAHSLKTRNIFIRRYWYLCSIQDIAESYGMTESNVKVLLFRMRNELKKQLEREGIYL